MTQCRNCGGKLFRHRILLAMDEFMYDDGSCADDSSLDEEYQILEPLTCDTCNALVDYKNDPDFSREVENKTTVISVNPLDQLTDWARKYLFDFGVLPKEEQYDPEEDYSQDFWIEVNEEYKYCWDTVKPLELVLFHSPRNIFSLQSVDIIQLESEPTDKLELILIASRHWEEKYDNNLPEWSVI